MESKAVAWAHPQAGPVRLFARLNVGGAGFTVFEFEAGTGYTTVTTLASGKNGANYALSLESELVHDSSLEALQKPLPRIGDSVTLMRACKD